MISVGSKRMTSGDFAKVLYQNEKVQLDPGAVEKVNLNFKAFRGSCSCGRTTLRLGPVLGRKPQMIKLKGITLYPPGIFEMLHTIDHMQDFLIEVFTCPLGTDELKLNVMVAEGHVAQVESRLKSVLQSHLRVIPEIHFSTASELERLQAGGRKPIKFIDRRG